MGKLVAVFRLMPEDTDVDIEAIKTAVKNATPKEAVLQGWQVKPVAFGLKALDVTITMEDDEGGSTDQLEAAYNGIAGVGSVQCVDVGRIG
ncbi:MAG TPA: elongation factor 1-beta [Candidatus Thermoplasmatota archaeon]|nr:elongation factor 1-beta [Candidatus Thermoplasmatota archaeon]